MGKTTLKNKNKFANVLEEEEEERFVWYTITMHAIKIQPTFIVLGHACVSNLYLAWFLEEKKEEKEQKLKNNRYLVTAT